MIVISLVVIRSRAFVQIVIKEIRKLGSLSWDSFGSEEKKFDGYLDLSIIW